MEAVAVLVTTRTEHPVSRRIVGVVLAGSVSVLSAAVAWASTTTPAPARVHGPTAADLQRAAYLRRMLEAIRDEHRRTSAERQRARVLEQHLASLRHRTARISVAPVRSGATGSGAGSQGPSSVPGPSSPVQSPPMSVPAAPPAPPAPVPPPAPPVQGSTGASGG
jgi:hypothetical protein